MQFSQFPTHIVPKLASVTGSSNAFDSVQVSVILKYNGGRPVTAIRIEFRVTGTTNVLSEYTATYPITNTAVTSWGFNVTNLQYEENGYEVIATPSNSIGQGDGFVSQPIALFTGSYLNNVDLVYYTTYVCICTMNSLNEIHTHSCDYNDRALNDITSIYKCLGSSSKT